MAENTKRSEDFQKWLNANPHVRERICKVPASQQGYVHDLVKFAFKSGYAKGVKAERKSQEPVEVGGYN